MYVIQNNMDSSNCYNCLIQGFSTIRLKFLHIACPFNKIQNTEKVNKCCPKNCLKISKVLLTLGSKYKTTQSWSECNIGIFYSFLGIC